MEKIYRRPDHELGDSRYGASPRPFAGHKPWRSKWAVLLFGTVLLQIGVFSYVSFLNATTPVGGEHRDQPQGAGESVAELVDLRDLGSRDESVRDSRNESARASLRTHSSELLHPEGAKNQFVEEGFGSEPEAPSSLAEDDVLVSPHTDDDGISREEQILSYTVGYGDTLISIWQAHGGTYAGAIAASKALKGAGVSLKQIRRGDTLLLSLGDGGEDIVQFQMKLPKGREVILTGDSESGYAAELVEPTIVEKTRTVTGVIQHSMVGTATEHRVPYEVIDDYVDLFSGRVGFRTDVRPGDSFTVIYKERYTDQGELIEPGVITSASFMNRGKMHVAIRHLGSDGNPRYYDGKGQRLGNYFLRYPVKFTRISSVFSKSRFHPVHRIHRPHYGVDFAAPTGTPVRSVADGIILKAGYTRANGNWIKVQHSKRWSTAYLHLSRISKNIRPGSRVTRGQVIGKVGSTGYATGPHLHFSLYDNGRYVDPMKTKVPIIEAEDDLIPVSFFKEKAAEHERLHNGILLAGHPDHTSRT